MYVTNLPYVWSLARQTFRSLRPEYITDYQTENKYTVGHSTPRSGERRGSGFYGLDTVDERATRVRSESAENIIEMSYGRSGGTVGPEDYAKHPNGSETVTWAESEGRRESREALKGDFITKTTEVIVQNEEKS